jgi:hypothetical protein
MIFRGLILSAYEDDVRGLGGEWCICLCLSERLKPNVVDEG